MRSKIQLLCVAVLLGCSYRGFSTNVESALAATASTSSAWPEVLQGHLKERLSFQGKVLTYGFFQRPISGSQNPGNVFLNIPRGGATFSVRPDVSYRAGFFEAMFRPRWEADYTFWDEGPQEGEDDWDEEAFVNEWMVRLRPWSSLAVSYGRENIQWGPAYFLSPTNPFFRDNGRSNPKQEVSGMDFFRAVWSPTVRWSFSLMVNTDEGRQKFLRGFEKTNAIKADYTGHRWYVSGIVSWQEQGSPVWGGYVGTTVSDALMVYGEANVRRGSLALYPVDDPSFPLGLNLEATKKQDNSLYPVVLLGISYTTLRGLTGVVEYLYHGAGYGEKEADLFYALTDRGAKSFDAPEPYAGLSRWILLKTLDPELRLLRRHYLMFQIQEADIKGRLDAVLRYTVNMDDGSSRLNHILELDLTDRWSVFFVGNQTFGRNLWGIWSSMDVNRTEFRRYGEYSMWLGLEYAF